MKSIVLDTLPRIILVTDYHKLLCLSDEIKDYLNIKVKCKELGCIGNYVGIVYQGKLPSKKIIDKMLRKQNIIFNTEEE